ncbi:MAG: hypothetical protein WCW02_00725 [Candidatus Buchananbacteria bacterium]
MLEHIFGSKARLKILQIFLNNPGRPFFVRELSRRLHTQINSVRQQLDTLSKLGIIELATTPSSLVDGQAPALAAGKEKKYYILNENFLLYPELKALFMKLQLVLEDNLLKQLEKAGKIYYLALTGTFCGRADSQTDMLLVGNISKEKLKKIIKKFEKDLGQEVDYTLMSLREFKYRRDVTDRFLYDILENKKVALVDRLEEAVVKSNNF